MDHIRVGESVRPEVVPFRGGDVSLKFMLLHVHCADFLNGLMKFNEGESQSSRYEDSSEYVDVGDDDNNDDDGVSSSM